MKYKIYSIGINEWRDCVVVRDNDSRQVASIKKDTSHDVLENSSRGVNETCGYVRVNYDSSCIVSFITREIRYSGVACAKEPN